MYIQKENKSIRRSHDIEYDIDFLRKYYSENRRFPLFNQVLIETRTDCNKKCSFCPQTHFQKPLGIMNINIFKSIVDKLTEIKFSGRLALYLSNEPLLEPRLLSMIKYARKKSSRFFIDITTNGVLLNETIIEQLFEVGLDNILINDYRSDRDLYPNRISKHLSSVFESFRYNPKLSYNFRSAKEIMSNYAGVINEPVIIDKGFCNFPFRKLCFSYKGDVLLCCNDFSYKTNLGNIKDIDIIDIWNSEKYNVVRKELLNHKRISLCADCNQFQEYSIY